MLCDGKMSLFSYFLACCLSACWPDAWPALGWPGYERFLPESALVSFLPVWGILLFVGQITSWGNGGADPKAGLDLHAADLGGCNSNHPMLAKNQPWAEACCTLKSPKEMKPVKILAWVDAHVIAKWKFLKSTYSLKSLGVNIHRLQPSAYACWINQ